VWFQKISIPPPHRVIGNFEGEEVLNAKIEKTNFQRGGGFKPKKTLHVGSRDIFCNNTV